MTKDVDTSRLNSYICPHSFTPLASNAYIYQRCGRDYIKETASFSSIRLRGLVMARNRKGHPYCDVTTIRQTRYFRSDDVIFQDGDAVDIGKLGRGRRFLPTTPSFFQCLPLRRFVWSSCTRIGLQFYYGAAACAAFGYFFLYDAC